MIRVFEKDYDKVEKCVPTGPNNPVTSFYLTNRYSSFRRELPFPETNDFELWESWRKKLRASLREILCLDQYADSPVAEYKVLEQVQCAGYVRHKIAYESLPGNWVSAYLLIPDGIQSPVPAILCPHGHFRGGKESVVKPEEAAGVAYGHEFARRGFIVLAPDNAGMAIGDSIGTNERDVPEIYAIQQEIGGCELLFRRLNHMGLDITGFRIYELMVGLNLLSSMKSVDNSRIGCAGLSGGCWLSQVLAALDDRIKAVILSGYFTTFVQTAWIGHCICHHPFGIGKVCDMPDISALIAPRPQFIESGKQDVSYPLEPAFSMLQRVYKYFGAPDKLGLDSFDGGHMFHGTESIPWMINLMTGKTI